MTRRSFFPAALVAIAGLWASAAAADGPLAMVTGATSLQPIGQYEMCEAHASECSRNPRTDPVPLTTAVLAQLDAVNRQVNSSITAMTDQQIYGQLEVWAYPTTVGDCEDFALLKQRLLEEMGFARGNLLMTMVYQSTGEAHAVLTVRTTGGDYILDNLSSEVKLWTDTAYLYVKRQAVRNSGSWVEIETPTTVPQLAVAEGNWTLPAGDGATLASPFGPIGGP